MLLKVFTIAVILHLSCQINSQDEIKKLQLDGYVKNLQTGMFYNFTNLNSGLDTTLFINDNLIHNRVNFKWFLTQHLSIKADLRTRVFWGESVKYNSLYANQINKESNDFYKLSALIRANNKFVLHTVFDRFYMEYSKGAWEIKLGRQRINWGINTLWNPNDVFNTLNFMDFDYEERPSSDALLVKYNNDLTSSFEIAVKAFSDWEEAVIAGLFKFNHAGYDFQVLTGLVANELVFGGGWDSNIKNMGFKGEFSYFFPFDDTDNESFSASLALDYTFKKGLFLSTGYLFNSSGKNSQPFFQLLTHEISAKNLYPYKQAIFVQSSYPLTPQLNGSLTLIYSANETHPLFVNPFFTYSIATDWTIDLVGQLVFDKQEKYQGRTQAIFLRTKFDFERLLSIQ